MLGADTKCIRLKVLHKVYSFFLWTRLYKSFILYHSIHFTAYKLESGKWIAGFLVPRTILYMDVLELTARQPNSFQLRF